MNLPNLITIGRLLLVPFVVAMIGQGHYALAFGGFVLAGLSDGIDGFIARRFHMRTELGAYLDAIADKALLVSIFVTLALVNAIAGWLAIVVVFRDVMIIGAVVISWLMAKPVAIRPLLISKLNTAAQIGFAAIMLWSKAFLGHAPPYAEFLAVATAALTIASAGAYLAQWLRHMAA